MKKILDESLNEFKQGQDPAKAMGIGYGNKPNTKIWKILEFIGSKGEEGASLTEIQHFVWTVLQGKPEEKFWKKSQTWAPGGSDKKVYLRSTRGYYTDALYASGEHRGLLQTYCVKNAKGKYVLTHMPKPGQSIFEPIR